jgi:two-component system, LytTR family, sensor kinase
MAWGHPAEWLGTAGTRTLRADLLSTAASTVGSWRFASLPVFWQGQILGWCLFFVFDLINRLLTYKDLTMAIGVSLVVLPCLIALSTALASIYASQKIGSRLTARSLALIVLLSATAAAIAVAAGFATRQLFGWSIPQWSLIEQVAVPWFHYLLALCAWSLCYFWIHAERAKQEEHRHAIRAEAEALRLELEELRLQLDPHFLFNALNGVAEEIPERPQAALSMLRDLTGYFRHSLDGINQTVVTVDAEVGGLTAYLGVQKARFGDRLRTHVHVEHAAGERHIASFLLQPLVENAVKHGRRDNGLDVHVDIRTAGDVLHVTIENTGTLGESAATRRRRPGIGLANVRRRLDLHYPGRHAFALAERDGKVAATLRLEGEPCSGS